MSEIVCREPFKQEIEMLDKGKHFEDCDQVSSLKTAKRKQTNLMEEVTQGDLPSLFLNVKVAG